MGIASGELLLRAGTTLQILAIAYTLGVLIAAAFIIAALANPWGAALLATLTAMFNPLPAIALLWFGLGAPSLIFVTVHAVLWPLALSGLSGMRGVAETQRMAARNLGLSGVRLVLLILVPAAFPALLSGLRNGWAFAWRTLIAAELVFGVSSKSGGLGWYIYINRNQLETANVFAGLLVIILIGLFIESVIFRTVARRTVERWGQQF